MNPTPNRWSLIPHHPPPIPSVVVHAELGECLRGTALPLGDERVADVAQVRDPHAAREESRRREVAEAVEERYPGGELGAGFLGPGDVVEDSGPLGIGAGNERLGVAVVALVVEPGEPAAQRCLEVAVVAE